MNQKDKDYKFLRDDKFSLLLDIIDQKKAVLEKFKFLHTESLPFKTKKAEDLEKAEAKKK